jgi:type IV pilus assembly protein PilY1
METADFINTGQPTKGVVQQYHLFCNKSTTGNNSYGPPLLRMLTNRTERIWDWISREVVQCGNTLGTGTAVTPTDYQVNVEVCNQAVGLEPNCKQYGSGSSATQKPIGLLQRYGDSDGTKICSKTFAKTCNNDPDCRPGSNNGVDLGMCVDRSRMYFGLLSGSYAHNLQGGVLRKNIISISDEVDIGNGFFKTAQNIPSNMVQAIDMLQIIDYTDASTNYANCVAQNQNITDGKCRDWGNPLAEMLYETLRYYAGKGTPTADYDYPQNQTDGGLNLPHPAYWGYQDGYRTFKGPYDIYPSCSKPFVLLLSDVYPSFDADQLPGVTNSSYAEDTSAHPVLGLDRTVNGKKYLSKLADDIAATESVTGNSFFIGDNGTTYDFICTPKTASGLSLLRGLCPEQPTRKGSFYTAALAYYAHSFMNAEIRKDTTPGLNTGIPNAQTFAVALASQVGNWTVKAGTNTLRIVPLGKSVSGAVNMDATCKNKCTLGTSLFPDNSFRSMTITNCAADAYCPTNEIVKVYTQSVKYDASGSPIYLSFRINFADCEQGADYDMDAVGWFEVCTQAAKNAGYGTCGTDMGSNQVEIKVVSDYAAGGIDQVLGFIVSGTSEDGTYLVVRDKSVTAGASLPNSLPFNWSHVFTVTGSGTGVLKDPLWYAAKWGGFQDRNGNNIPDQKAEWAQNCTESDVSRCNPDNYYLVVNPLKLETQLEKAFTDILARVSSGTASSILNNSEGSGANLFQALFYPQKNFDNNTSVDWIGEMQNLWYYIDPFFNGSTVRVDTNADYSLDLTSDYIAHFRFDAGQNQTVVDLVKDVNGNGSNLANVATGLSPDDPSVKSLWRAGRLLWQRDVSATGDPRNIYTVTSAAAGTPLAAFKNDGTFNADATVQKLLQAADSAEAGKIVSFVQGIDQAGYRGRKVTILGCGLADTQGCTREWKLGDIVNSTPKLESTIKLQSFDTPSPNGYGDTSYAMFVASANYQKRGMAFAGANDGMLHAFKLGILDVSGQTATHKATMRNTDGSAATVASNLGREEWAFIPHNALPYLKYMTDPDYAHLYYVDNTSLLVDASINAPSDNNTAIYPNCDAANYWNCGKKTSTDTGGNLVMDRSSWRTILIGGMGFGGASRNSTDTCTPGGGGTCVKTPLAATGYTGVGYSSYFALDVTNPHVLPGGVNPVRFLWEFNGDPANGDYLGYSTTGPAIVRIGSASRNGRWFAMFGSGPTGPIDTVAHSFQGTSDQELKLFVVDLATGTLVRTIRTGVANAFAGSLSTNVIDTDRWNSLSPGFYSDDAIYVGYVQKDVSTGTWTKGGVLRVLTKEDTNPANWVTSTVISGIGPVTTAVTKLQDRNAIYDKAKPAAAQGKLWLYFGTGRYFYKSDALDNQYRLYGIQDPCYSSNSGYPAFTPMGPKNDFDLSGTTATCNTVITEPDLQDQSGDSATAPASTLPAGKLGWYVSLDTSAINDGFSSERVVTNPVASPSGAVFFTTFRPTADICGFGGNSNVWALRYDTGAAPPTAAMGGRALMQTSTGALAEVSLATAFANPTDRRYDNRRTATAISGMPPSANGLALISNPKPVKKILHFQEM